MDDVAAGRVPALVATEPAVGHAGRPVREHSSGQDAEVFVDGMRADSGATTIGRIGTGVHEASVSATGYRSESCKVDVTADGTIQVDIALKRDAFEGNVGRIALNRAVAGGGLALGIAAFASHVESGDAYDCFVTVDSDADATRIVDQEVQPAQTATLVYDIVGAALLVGAGAL